MNKKKILNDPVYGFVSLNHDLLYEIIQHPIFQRLRRIKQLGLTDLVYPGAIHTRFHHAIGAMHLMSVALDNLRKKGIDISDEEYLASQVAILLHDIGHGPFSHTLESTILENVSHEQLSLLLMEQFNQEFGGNLRLAIDIFTGNYSRKFLHQLVSSQLDVDRLDYLSRDSFYTGVSEGSIGVTRIINMLAVVKNELVVEEKGIYSIENFLNARRLMYWQVYLHKATVSAEKMLGNAIRRARYLAANGQKIEASRALKKFLQQNVTIDVFTSHKSFLQAFSDLDDSDIWGALKAWRYSKDKVLSTLSNWIINRQLFKIQLHQSAFGSKEKAAIKRKIARSYDLSLAEANYLISEGILYNSAYIPSKKKIKILRKTGEVLNITDASDLPNIAAISKIVKKHYRCFPKDVSL